MAQQQPGEQEDGAAGKSDEKPALPAAGNLIDRARLGYVVDFLDFHWNWLSPFFLYGHFPAFNIADAAITVGVIGLLLNEALAIIGGFGRKRVI